MASRKKSKAISSSRNSRSNKRFKESIDLSGFREDDDEHIESSDEDDDVHTPSFRDEYDDESEEENVEVKKVRLAREYLAAIEEKDVASDDSEASSVDDDDDHGVSRKLQRARLHRQGALERNYADRLRDSFNNLRLQNTTLPSSLGDTEAEMAAWTKSGIVSLFHGGGHDLTPTCVAMTGSGDDKVVSGSKDHSVLLWDVETQTRLSVLSERWQRQKNQQAREKAGKDSHRTSGQVLSVTCSDDGKYVAVGRRDATVSIFDIRVRGGENRSVKTFTGHKGAVTSLAFRSQTHQLFTASADRCIRHYNLDEMLYLETLYGHQFGVTGIDCHRAERPVSVGSDRTARAWKIAEDSHLIFRGGAKMSSAEAVTVLKDDYFVTGHQDGAISLWSTEKKRAVASIPNAHGTVGSLGIGRGVVSITSVKGSDVVATGANDGYLRLWKVVIGGSNTTNKKENRGGAIEVIGEIPIHGFINGIALSSKAKFSVVAVGQEHRCGRWERVPRAKNRIAIVKLQAPTDESAIDENETLVDVREID